MPLRSKPSTSTPRSRALSPERLTEAERGIIFRAASLVAEHYRLFRPLIFAETRSKLKVATARQITMYLANCSGSISFTKIAKAFGRDLATVTHNIQLIEDKRDDDTFNATLEGLEAAFASSPELQQRDQRTVDTVGSAGSSPVRAPT